MAKEVKKETKKTTKKVEKEVKNNAHEVIIKIEGKEWETAQDNAFKKIQKEVKLDGFRKGKVPKDIYIKHFGTRDILFEAAEKCLQEAYIRAMDESKLIPVAQPAADIKSLDEKPFDFGYITAQFYKDYGVGNFGLHKSFRIKEENNAAKIVPITNSENIRLTDLIGYEKQKQQLIDNTEAFIRGEKANNVLLFGESGTGKSSSVKAILNEYYKDGLRMIEIFKHQFGNLTSVIEQIKDRNYKFIIYMDDLSFEETELEYKYLKAVIEGGLEKRPDNVLIYATSNRRHIVKERWDERKQSADDVHGNDSKQEKLSLYARFGVTIYYGSPMQKDYLKIVDGIADRMGLTIEKEKLHQEAIKWELAHGGFSGRVAEQCVTHLLALQNMNK